MKKTTKPVKVPALKTKRSSFRWWVGLADAYVSSASVDDGRLVGFRHRKSTTHGFLYTNAANRGYAIRDTDDNGNKFPTVFVSRNKEEVLIWLKGVEAGIACIYDICAPPTEQPPQSPFVFDF
jgi:hypothetical protein